MDERVVVMAEKLKATNRLAFYDSVSDEIRAEVNRREAKRREAEKEHARGAH